MSLPSTLSLGSVEGYNLNLISGITTTDGKTYYYWDRNGDGTANSADRIRYNDQYILDNLFNNGQLSEDDGQQIIAGADTSRSVLVGDYTVVLPTYSELQELYDLSPSNPPGGWYPLAYWSSSFGINNTYNRYYLYLDNGTGNNNSDGVTRSAAFYVLETPDTEDPTYELISLRPNGVDEAGSAAWQLNTTNVSRDTQVPYVITGISVDDVVGGSLTGIAIIGADGTATITIPLRQDQVTEGDEFVSVSVFDQVSPSIRIFDTSRSPELSAVTSITSSVSEQREGAGQIIFTIATQGYDQGASVDYALSGISAVDIVGGRLSGSATVGATGSATVTVIPQADNMQEGRETVTISAGGQTASADILDQLGAAASYNVSTLSTSVNEGGQVMFTVTGTGVQSGDFAEYTIGGAGITSSDILGGILTGYATFNASGQATVMVQTSADLTTEGEETLSLTVGEASASVTLNDTSRGQGSYTVNAGSLRVNEGDVAVFTVTGQNVPAGTSVGYTVTGVDASDLQQGTLTGLVVMGPTGVGQIQIPIAADGATEGVESLTVTVGDSSAAVLIGDTSNGTLVKEFTNTIANEVFVATSASNTFEVGARKDQVQIQSFDGGQTWQMTSSDFGTDTIAGFDRVKFSNTTLALDFQSGDAGYNTVMMIGAAFGPAYTQTYFAPGVNLYDQGYSDREVAELIVETGLIEGIVNGDNADWVDFVYSNVAGVKPDALTRQLFANQIADGTTTKADLLVLASENMFEGTVGIPGLQANGLEFSSFG